MKFGDAFFAVTSNRQKLVSLNLTGAMYVTLTETVKTVVWLRNVLKKLSVDQKSLQVLQGIIGCIEGAAGGAA